MSATGFRFQHRVVRSIGEYDVVIDLDAQQFTGLLETFGDVFVFVVGPVVAARVVVCDECRGGAFLQGLGKDLSRMYDRPVI